VIRLVVDESPWGGYRPLGQTPLGGSPPFTPSGEEDVGTDFCEAFLLGHDYIGTEHIPFGVLGHWVLWKFDLAGRRR